MIEPTADEYAKINTLFERLQQSDFTWSIYKAKPSTPKELSRWDVKIEHVSRKTLFGIGQAAELPTAILRACKCLAKLVVQQYEDLERAPYSKEIKALLAESERLLESKANEVKSPSVRRK